MTPEEQADRIAHLERLTANQREHIRKMEAGIAERKKARAGHAAEIAKREVAVERGKVANSVLRACIRELEAKLGEKTRQVEVLEAREVARATEVQVASTRAVSILTRHNSALRRLLALVSALENERADDDAFWERVDEATRQARWLLESEYRIAKAGKEAA